ncbi:MAG TPA: amidohydrolase family protein [Intrasporangium sp.]|uniref:amidohydrolase n=1 Tax=Intrasporangium sp. TaxID=1925024 RepID=UPI002D79DE13|nr:amidohydrolase family protein [Intrasporangium sp.]HET7397841.1 amidohydrolase family protein [Intrasporangium sp.]
MTTRLFVGGKVFLGTGEDDFATAFRVTDGRFSWVGDEAGLTSVERSGAEDLGGRAVLPGLLDVHSHPALLATLAGWVSCLPPDVRSREALVDRLRTSPDLGRADDTWVLGFGYDEQSFPDRRPPTAADLDRVSKTQPVFVVRCDGHSAVCNTRALQLAGITRDTPNPEGARFERDSGGHPTGVLTEVAAADAVRAVIPRPGRAELVARLAGLSRHFLERGVVAVADLWSTVLPQPLELFRDAAAAGLVPQIGLYLGWTDLRDGPLPELTDAHRTGRVRVAGVKLFLDGAFSNRTAWTKEAYPDSCSHGIRTASDADLREAVAWARRNGVQVAVHAMGDRALEHVVGLLGVEEPWLGDLPSIRLEHATLVGPALIEQINAARMSFAVVTHTIFLFAEHAAYAANLTERQFPVAYPIRSLYNGIRHLALSSDTPATAWADADNVFVSLKAAVLRRAHTGADINAEEAVTVAQALLLYTGRAGTVCPLDHVGVIAEGFEGSFVVLDRDPFSIDPDELDRVQVHQTWVAGERVFARS